MTENNSLSPREEEILALVARGLTNREIAQRLSISPNTVKVHLSNIFSKTGVSSRTEATLYGIEQGLVDVPRSGEGSGAAPAGRVTFWQFRWVWGAMILLLVLILATLLANVIFPPAEPEANTQDLTERWKELDPLPEPLQDMAASAYAGDLFVFGGEGRSGVSGAVHLYDFETGRWETRQAKPLPVADIQSVTIGERIFIPGGRKQNGELTPVLEIYDPREDLWGMGAPLPTALSGYALVNFEGEMYLFGGWDGTSAVSQVLIYDPAADAWQEGQQMPQPRADARAVALEDKIIIMGGRTEAGISPDAFAYFPARDAAGEDPWEPYIGLPEPRYDFCAANVFEKIYLIGGKSGVDDPSQKGGWLMTGEEWVRLPTEKDYTDRECLMVPLGAELALFDTPGLPAPTSVWTYQAFYYSIYIPIVP